MTKLPLLLALSALGCASTPLLVQGEIAATPQGQATVVEFIDFQCPFCRKNHEALAPLLAARKGRVRVVRKHVPLPIHANAASAARASVCADAQGRGDEMADALFRAPVLELDAEGCAHIAERLGLDVARFSACVSDRTTARRIEQDERDFDAVGGTGVPLLYVGTERLDGMQDADTLEKSLDRALAR
jgi:protein-disulfide isomerase